MKTRALRIKVTVNVPATLADSTYELIDISVTGAFGAIDAELPIGSVHPLRLGTPGQEMDLAGRVVRVVPTENHGRWRTAVAFEGLTPTLQRSISHHVGRLLAMPRRRVAAGAQPARMS
jgi:hypothetical protein